jgi:hypothetical protein
MKYIDSPWAAVFLLMGFLTFVESLHMYEHKHCRDCTPCATTQNYHVSRSETAGGQLSQ